MRKLYSMRAYLTLCILAISTLIGGVSAQATEKWVEVDITELTSTDVFVIADATSAKAMPTDKGTSSAPTATTITLNADKTEITSPIADNLKWTLEIVNKQYKFIPVGQNTALYCTATNNGVRVGTNANNLFEWDATNNKLKNVATSRWIGVYNSQDWRCYTTASQTNIKNTVTKFYKYVDDTKLTPKISFEQEAYNVNLGEIATVKATATLGEETLAGDLISYTSSNPNIAEIDAKSGIVTAKAEGTVTITATILATATYNKKEATCTLTVVDTRPAPTFAFSQETYLVNINGTLSAAVSTNSSGTINYTSSNEEVATIDATGNVTAIAEGETTITATIAATSEYKAAETTCIVKVTDPNKPAEVVTPMSFKKVTSTDELIEGGQYIIVCEDQKAVMTEISNKRGQVAQNITIADGTIATDCGAGIITIQKSGDDYVLNLSNSWISATSSTDLILNSTNTSQNEKWSITFDETTGAAQMTSTDGSRYIRYNTNNGSPMFRNYSSTQANSYSIQLYRLETSATINEKIGYTTFYTDKVYQLANGMTAYAISESDEAGKVNAIEAYAAGEDVPTNTALLLGGEAGTYRLPVLNKEVAAYEGENLLEGKRMADGMTRSDRENVLYYKLTTLNGETPGFYWGAEEGAAFIMKNPTTAYLAVDKAVAGANGLRLVIGESGTTGIGTVTETTQDGAIYTISGVRVNAGSTAGLPKGIYIVNGKKLLVK